jgi:hypothetical protein
VIPAPVHRLSITEGFHAIDGDGLGRRRLNPGCIIERFKVPKMLPSDTVVLRNGAREAAPLNAGKDLLFGGFA